MLHQRAANLPFTFVPAIGNTPARNYSYLDGDQDETRTLASSSPGQFDLALISNHTVKGGLTDTCLDHRLSVPPYFTWAENVTTRPDNPTYKGQDADRYFVLNLSVNYETDTYRLWSLVRNITDESYTTPA
ncbi:MAG: hypothetical protein ACI9TH_001896 [Kiritimatiellia bacterium]|jgi:hypothetical protein